MIDLKLLRDNPDVARESQRTRGEDPALIDQLSAAVERCGLPPRRLPSGAGHDAMAVASLCPVGMLFTRCRGGISHNPAESITVEDADLTVRVLLDFIRHLRR